jgi:acyl-CoA reductase-like NAD-dependent aldehyde dehydrogenase
MTDQGRRCEEPTGRRHAPPEDRFHDEAISGRPDAPVIVVHSLVQAIAALTAASRAGRSVVLASTPGAGSYVGPGWFGALVAAAREAVPDAHFSILLDCGDDVGAALAAIRSEIQGVVFTGRADVARRLADIACQHGVRFVTDRPAALLDLGDDFFASPEILERRCADLLT